MLGDMKVSREIRRRLDVKQSPSDERLRRLRNVDQSVHSSSSTSSSSIDGYLCGRRGQRDALVVGKAGQKENHFRAHKTVNFRSHGARFEFGFRLWI